ncbi:MAG: DUF3488 and transglutaminase-like domain-containing protein [Desulfobacteraceae bacterium]|jgi:transglutaminase-like putative cysteine protease
MRLDSLRVIKWYSASLGVAAGAVVFAYLGFGPVIIGALVFGCASYLSLAAIRNIDEENSPYRKISEYIAAAGMAAFLPLVLLGDFLLALVIFLGMAQLGLNLQTHDYRRFYVGVIVSFIGICVGAAESKSGFYLVFFMLYTISAGITIGYAYMAQRQGVEKSDWHWTDRARVCLMMTGAALCIYLLLPRLPAGGWLAQPGSDHFYHDKTWEAEAKQNRNTEAGHQIDDLIDDLGQGQREDQSGGTLEALLTRRHAPDSDSGDTGRQGRGAFDYNGFHKEFNINDPDEKGHRFSNQIVARMRADRPQYLRVRIFDIFDGLRWRSSSDQMVKLEVGLDGVDLILPGQYSASDVQRYEIYIEHPLDNYIPAAAVPVNLQFPASAIGVDVFGQLRCPGALKQGTAYAVTSKYNFQKGRLFAELDHQPLPSYTQLPGGTDPRIKELAGDVTQGAASQLDAAISLEHHLRTQYQYDFDAVISSQNYTPLSEFLFETRSGHCEYFASALAIMLRTQDIPARLVTGFSATNRNPLTGYYDIYALDGHAWVEAFVDDMGWIILEPTAYYNGPLPEQEGLSAQQINDYVKRQVQRRNALGDTSLNPTAIINALWQLLYVVVSAGLAYIKLFFIHGWPGIIAVCAIGIICWIGWRRYGCQWRAYHLHRKVALYGSEKSSEAIGFYLNAIEELLSLAGFKHHPGHTIERYLAELESMGAVQADDALAAAFNGIYYNNEEGHLEAAENYRRLFRSLYDMGLPALQSAAVKSDL